MNTRGHCWRRLRSWNLRLTECERLLATACCQLVAKGSAFQTQQKCLGGESAAVSSQCLSASQHPVTGHHNRDRIVMVRLSHGAIGVRTAYGSSNVTIAARLAIRNAEQLSPTFTLEVGAAEVKGHGEFPAPPGEVLVQLLLHVPAGGRRFLPADPPPAQRGWKVVAKRKQRQSVFRRSEDQRTHRRIHARIVKGFHVTLGLLSARDATLKPPDAQIIAGICKSDARPRRREGLFVKQFEQLNVAATATSNHLQGLSVSGKKPHRQRLLNLFRHLSSQRSKIRKTPAAKRHPNELTVGPRE